jgi:hypothetical protein
MKVQTGATITTQNTVMKLQKPMTGGQTHSFLSSSFSCEFHKLLFTAHFDNARLYILIFVDLYHLVEHKTGLNEIISKLLCFEFEAFHALVTSLPCQAGY